jgi:hypothetical protein
VKASETQRLERAGGEEGQGTRKIPRMCFTRGTTLTPTSFVICIIYFRVFFRSLTPAFLPPMRGVVSLFPNLLTGISSSSGKTRLSLGRVAGYSQEPLVRSLHQGIYTFLSSSSSSSSSTAVAARAPLATSPPHPLATLATLAAPLAAPLPPPRYTSAPFILSK